VPECEINAEWRQLHGEEFHNPYVSINIHRAIELKVIELHCHIGDVSGK